MMKLIVNFAIIVLIFFGCSNGDKSVNTDYNTKYKKILNFFGDSLVDHFPRQDTINSSQTLDTFCYHNTLSFQFSLFDANAKIGSVLNLYSKNILAKYKADDSNLLVVNDYVNKKNSGDPFRAAESTFIEDSLNKKYPVPNFWGSDLATSETRCKLPKDFLFYILDSKIGIFSKKIKLDQSSMPISMRHGYSKGIAISNERNIIIYWIIIW